MAFDDLAADGQADTGSFVTFMTMQALENGEDTIEVFLVEADAVILYKQSVRFYFTIFCLDRFGMDADFRWQPCEPDGDCGRTRSR